MTAECSYCGEIKLCRKEFIEGYITIKPYNWICKECDIARAIIRNEERLAAAKKEKQNQLNWRKERDKLLKQNDK